MAGTAIAILWPLVEAAWVYTPLAEDYRVQKYPVSWYPHWTAELITYVASDNIYII